MTDTPAGTAPVIFYSYSHRDEDLKDRLDAHLSSLKRQGLIRAWHDRKIAPGADWATEIDEHVATADIFLALVSADFISSDYCWGVELARALDRHARSEAVVVPIIVRPVDWHSTPLGRLQALPRDGRAVTTWRNQDLAWTDVARGLRSLIQGSNPSHATEGNLASTAVRKTTPPDRHHHIGFSHINVVPDKMPRWKEHPHRAEDCVFNRACDLFLHLEDFVVGADLWLDVTILNHSRSPLILTSVGCEILEITHITYAYGFPSAAKISPSTDEYVLDMPDLQRHLFTAPPGLLEWPSMIVDHQIRTRLPDPVYLPARAPYRYLLRFKHYQGRIPNHARLRLLAEVDGEVTKSRTIHVFTW